MKIINDIINFGQQVIQCLQKISEIPLITNMIAPITAAILSWCLATHSLNKRQANKLYIILSLIKAEIENNIIELTYFVSEYKENIKTKKRIEYLPTLGEEDYLLSSLNRIKKIEKNYFFFRPNIVEEMPMKLVLITQDVEKLNEEIEKSRNKLNICDNVEVQKQITNEIARKLDEIEKLKKQYNTLSKVNIYDDFKDIQTDLEKIQINNLAKVEKGELTGARLFLIYSIIKDFNAIKNKRKEDLLKLYDDLLLHTIKDDYEDELQEWYYDSYKDHPMYDIWIDYFRYKKSSKRMQDFLYTPKNSLWNSVKTEFIQISDRDMYLSINKLYTQLENLMVSKPLNMDEVYDYYNKCDILINETLYLQKKVTLKEIVLGMTCQGILCYILKKIFNFVHMIIAYIYAILVKKIKRIRLKIEIYRRSKKHRSNLCVGSNKNNSNAK